MVFSEPIFLFIFLPLTLALYFISGRGARNIVLLLMSLFFYAWGEKIYVLVLLGSIAVNYGFGLLISGALGRRRLVALWGGVFANLALLGYFKYTGFLLGSFGFADAAAHAPPLPIGISFFTFQALSYLIDLYFGRVQVQRDPLRLALYISLFPQLIAGPIVRYAEIDAALIDRTTTRGDVSAGTHRFVQGLAKKAFLADPLGLVADQIFGIPAGGLSLEVAWLGALCYSLQLYFDFSAYSDMAIGLGRIFGFRFPENFDYPYVSTSITEFWRRWHMTLSRWFRDYLYIPLGGNRAGSGRTYLNLSIVFLATGLWHGAAWTFVFWGAYHGAFLILERLGLGRLLLLSPRGLRHTYLILVVIFGWVAFRAETFAQMSDFYASMVLGRAGAEADFYPLARYLDLYVGILILIASALSVGAAKWFLPPSEPADGSSSPRMTFIQEGWFWILFLGTLISVGASSYSPFIYFRF